MHLRLEIERKLENGVVVSGARDALEDDGGDVLGDDVFGSFG